MIPGCPIAYWASKSDVNAFASVKLGDIGSTSKGIITGDNSRFLRLWHEVDYLNIEQNSCSSTDSKKKAEENVPGTWKPS